MHNMNPHTHGTYPQEMLLTMVKKERKETQEYKERRETLVHGDYLAHKVWEVFEEESFCRRTGEKMKFLTTMLGFIVVMKSTHRPIGVGLKALEIGGGGGGNGGEDDL